MAVSGLCSVDGCGKPIRSRGWCGAHHRRVLRYGDPLAGNTLRGAPHAFLEAALAAKSDDCLLWPYSRHTKGSARIKIAGKTYEAARVVCERAHGAPPTPQHEAAHSCGRGHEGCINPKHLRWATSSENHADKLLHGTDFRGERNPQSTLTETQVADIRCCAAAGESHAAIGRRFGVCRSTIGAIVRREIWAWLA